MAAQEPDTQILLQRWHDGNADALRDVVGWVYTDLSRVARAFLHQERQAETLRTSGLLGEVYLKLLDVDPDQVPTDRAGFLNFAARIMRNLLVDYARRRRAEKRGGAGLPVSLSDLTTLVEQKPEMVEAVSETIEAFRPRFPRQMHVLELRYFMGFQHAEIAQSLDLSVRTVKSDARFALSLLRQELAL